MKEHLEAEITLRRFSIISSKYLQGLKLLLTISLQITDKHEMFSMTLHVSLPVP